MGKAKTKTPQQKSTNVSPEGPGDGKEEPDTVRQIPMSAPGGREPGEAAVLGSRAGPAPGTPGASVAVTGP